MNYYHSLYFANQHYLALVVLTNQKKYLWTYNNNILYKVVNIQRNKVNYCDC